MECTGGSCLTYLLTSLEYLIGEGLIYQRKLSKMTQNKDIQALIDKRQSLQDRMDAGPLNRNWRDEYEYALFCEQHDHDIITALQSQIEYLETEIAKSRRYSKSKNSKILKQHEQIAKQQKVIEAKDGILSRLFQQ